MSASHTVVLNVGIKTFDLKPGPNGEKRALLPGQSIETLDEAEAKQLLSYFREIKDASKVVPANAARITSMQAEIERLTADNARLAGQKTHQESKPKAEEPQAEEPKEEKHKGKKAK